MEPLIDQYPVNHFKTVIADPPWQYDDQPPRGGAGKHYQLMDLDGIKNIDVKAVTSDEAHLYLWTTNAFMKEAFDVAESWGFEQKTILTWVKNSMGVGWYFRNTTEHVLFCTRGDLKTEVDDIETHFRADRDKHSKKPSTLYEIATKASKQPMLELFARKSYGEIEAVGDEQYTIEKASKSDW